MSRIEKVKIIRLLQKNKNKNAAQLAEVPSSKAAFPGTIHSIDSKTIDKFIGKLQIMELLFRFCLNSCFVSYGYSRSCEWIWVGFHCSSDIRSLERNGRYFLESCH